MNTITICVIYAIIALIIYAILKSIKKDIDDMPSPRIGGKWFNTNSTDTSYSDEEYEEMIIVTSMVWPCSIIAALCLFLITTVFVFIQMLKNNNE